MKIKVAENTYIENDSRQFIIKEYTGKIDNDGREITKVHGYFPRLSSAIKALIRKEFMATNLTELNQILPELKRLEKKYDRLLNI